jgi:hypothetical protein
MDTITRQQFIEAIEAGIESAGELTTTEIQLLRHVARTETRTTYGTFESTRGNTTCFCPLSAAGIQDGGGGPMPEPHFKFYRGYDQSISIFAMERGCAFDQIEVVG